MVCFERKKWKLNESQMLRVKRNKNGTIKKVMRNIFAISASFLFNKIILYAIRQKN